MPVRCVQRARLCHEERETLETLPCLWESHSDPVELTVGFTPDTGRGAVRQACELCQWNVFRAQKIAQRPMF